LEKIIFPVWFIPGNEWGKNIGSLSAEIASLAGKCKGRKK
jgi:hypothetical protein